jgi:L,D-transpeptidase ErfK/SrfK
MHGTARMIAAWAALAMMLLSGSPALAGRAIGTMRIYVTEETDTLVDIAVTEGVGFLELKAANPDVDVWAPVAGTRVMIPSMHLLPDAPEKGIVINLADMRLYLFNVGDVISWPIGIGREGRITPLGATRAVRKARDPFWYPPNSVRQEKPWLPARVEPGPDNPLGDRAIYLGWPRYLIHGTNKPYGVGRRVSSGCIRMYPEDVQSLFELVEPGTSVLVVNQPVKLGWIDGVLFVEVHPTAAQQEQLEEDGRFTPEIPEDLTPRVIKATSGRDVSIDWNAVRAAGIQRLGYPVPVTSPVLITR